MADAWDPGRYARFRAERSQPFFDLLRLVQWRPGMRVVDLGCGSGELTRVLHERLTAAETVGVDSSDAMLARAADQVVSGLRFARGDIAAWEARDLDLVFSNAALHWVDGHEALLGRLRAALAPGGQLAVQLPANHEHPSQTVAAELAAEAPFAAALGGFVRRSPVLPPAAYATVLDQLGFASQQVRLQVYGHRLASRDDVVEWVRGTTLTAYESRLPAPLYAEFLARYRERLLARLPEERPFFFPFPRILAWGWLATG
jgi:trans-aconitate 2-methyltransferase